MPGCINLRETFGSRFRVKLEPPARQFRDPWYQVIFCWRGHIYPHGGDRLAWASPPKSMLTHRILAIPGTVLEQAGTDGCNVSFPAAVFDQVAAIVKPRRRRRLSAEARARAIACLSRYWGRGPGKTAPFRSGTHPESSP